MNKEKQVKISENTSLINNLNEVKTKKVKGKSYTIPNVKQLVNAMYKDKATRRALKSLGK